MNYPIISCQYLWCMYERVSTSQDDVQQDFKTSKKLFSNSWFHYTYDSYSPCHKDRIIIRHHDCYRDLKWKESRNNLSCHFFFQLYLKKAREYNCSTQKILIMILSFWRGNMRSDIKFSTKIQKSNKCIVDNYVPTLLIEFQSIPILTHSK